ncbi:nucleoprotein TPR isoform X2 [Austrofundulus limnaeus]|uniref:Nucleoprotein TPR isoform X2 n=1 Tax=Austrofundulus limnaeus TaxID=52670 RepID=A0A2I4AL06_AUSLI|nr:PREDICTED: nucleoprotein TPR-like isoform X2 [Austrofundulus limnaeus]
MITPAPVPTPTPTATVMPTTQVETQEAAMQSSEGPPVEHVTVYGSASGSVRSASPNVQTTLASPILTVQQIQTQATAFVQPTQQQSVTHPEPANQEPPPVVIEAAPSPQVDWPSTFPTTSVFGTVSATPGTSALTKRPREEEESSAVAIDTEAAQEDNSRAPIPKKLRINQRVGQEEEMQAEDSAEPEGVVPTDSQDGAEVNQTEEFSNLEEAEDAATSQSMSVEQLLTPTQSETPDPLQHEVIVILTDSESEEHEEEEEEEEEAKKTSAEEKNEAEEEDAEEEEAEKEATDEKLEDEILRRSPRSRKSRKD